MSGKTKNNKKRNRQHSNPQKAQRARNTAETENEIMQRSIDPPIKHTGKPLFMRIVMLAIAAVMILGIVVSAVAGNAGGFF
jgi:lipopolysaccharide/colanic/teichoic acid biosynthesis glycosyltransferase